MIMGSGHATENTLEQVRDKEIADEPDYKEVLDLILEELRKMNIQFEIITGDKI